MVKDAHGGAPVLVDVRPAVDPVHVLVPVAEAEVATRYDFGGKVICRRGRKSFMINILAYAITSIIFNYISSILLVLM